MIEVFSNNFTSSNAQLPTVQKHTDEVAFVECVQPALEALPTVLHACTAHAPPTANHKLSKSQVPLPTLHPVHNRKTTDPAYFPHSDMQ